MANDIKILSVDIGTFTGATLEPKVYLPALGGGITIKDVQVVGQGAGTSVGLILVKATDVGTPAVSGTLATFGGTIVYAQGVVFEATVGTAFVDDGCWLAVDQASGTAPTNTILNIAYVDGK